MTTPLHDPETDGFDQIRRGLSQLQAPIEPFTATQLADPALRKRIEGILDERFRKRYWIRIFGALGTLLVIVATLVTLAFVQNAQGIERDNNQDLALQRSQDTINAFQNQLNSANPRLIAMGLAPVQAPANVQPGSPEQAELILAAAKASIVADFPRQVIDKPVTEKLAEASAQGVSNFVALNRGQVIVSPQQVIDQVAAYLNANQGRLRGPQGDPGLPAPAPTAQQITDAFLGAAQSNPQILCAGGGVFRQLDVALANGGTARQFGCFADVAGPPPRPVDPAPTTSPDPGEGGNTGGEEPTPQDGSESPSIPEPTSVPTTPAPASPSDGIGLS